MLAHGLVGIAEGVSRHLVESGVDFDPDVLGSQIADLAWAGAASSLVDIVRDGAIIATTANDGIYQDNTGNKGTRTYVYRVCQAGTGTCSNDVTLVY